MNTRIQVEHPITEEVTGLDLVGLQIDSAYHETYDFAQNGISSTGHAIECRIYAEDPAKKFFPSPGYLTKFNLPKAQNGSIRIDTGYRENDTVTPFYAPLLAKIISHGPNRELAIETMRDALKNVEIKGIQTNVSFLLSILEHPDFESGNYDTNFVKHNHQKLINS